MLQNWVSHRCTCVKLSGKGGVAPFWGAANLAEKVSQKLPAYSGACLLAAVFGRELLCLQLVCSSSFACTLSFLLTNCNLFAS